MVNLEIASPSGFQDIQQNNHFVPTGGAVVAAEADIDDIIRRKHIRVSLRNCTRCAICPKCAKLSGEIPPVRLNWAAKIRHFASNI